MILSYSHAVTSEPAVEPVTVEAAKRNCDADDNYRDEDFARWIAAARRKVEADTRRALITQTHVLKLDAFPVGDWIDLPQPPLSSVTSVQYVDTGGTSQTFASSKYTVDTARTPGAILLAYAETWPTPRPQRNAVTVTYVAGYGANGTAVPEPLIDAVLILVKHRFENPELASFGSMAELPMAYSDLVCSSPCYWGAYP